MCAPYLCEAVHSWWLTSDNIYPALGITHTSMQESHHRGSINLPPWTHQLFCCKICVRKCNILSWQPHKTNLHISFWPILYTQTTQHITSNRNVLFTISFEDLVNKGTVYKCIPLDTFQFNSPSGVFVSNNNLTHQTTHWSNLTLVL